MWNVSLLIHSGTLKQAPRQESFVPLSTSTVVAMRCSARPMRRTVLELMKLWVAPHVNKDADTLPKDG